MPNYGIMRVEKRKAGDLGGISAEVERMDPINLPRSDIDWNKTHDNYFLISDNKPWGQRVKEVLKEHGIEKAPRKDAVLVIDGLYTATPEFMATLSKDEQKQYFEECIDFHRQHYGPVISAIVHIDESNPHMHVASVPLIQRDDGHWSLSAKDLLGGPAEFRKKQDAFYTEITESWGLERGEISDPNEKRKHKDTMECKIQDLENRLETLEIEKKELETEKQELKTEVENIREHIPHLETIRDKLSDWFGKIMSVVDVIRDRLGAFMDKIESKQTITTDDLKAASCRMERMEEDNYNQRPLCTPTFNGKPFAYDEALIPIYARYNDQYVPRGIYDICDNEYRAGWPSVDSYRPSVDYMVESMIDDIEYDRLEIGRAIRDIERLDADLEQTERDSID